MDFFLIYDYIGPNGYIPFYYKKEDLSKVLDDNQKKLIKYNKFSKSIRQILTKQLNTTPDDIKNNFYLVLIDDKLKNEPLENILSDTLNLLIKNNPNNIKIIYFNHEVTMHTSI
jgi:hypothetical protein